jgi:L-alanine-DL-glutamate epimerase-like enolase superfamily enzyme
MNYEVHHGGNSLNNVANLRLVTAIRNCEFFEVLLPGRRPEVRAGRGHRRRRGGLVHASAGPGLGARIDFELIERRRLAVLR